MIRGPLVLPLADSRCGQAALSGGKGASLATMARAGLPVPPGFVVTSAAFYGAVDEAALRERTRAKDMAGAREIVRAATPPADLVGGEYVKLTEPVAVRSSACAEDSKGASYAGQQETYLNVKGLETVIGHIVDCWLSFFADRAVFYRQKKGSLDDIGMAVVVQQMVNSQKSGVLFTADPVHHRLDRMVIEAAMGLGERVVSGEITPDHYVIDRSGAIKRSRIVTEQVLTPEECSRLAAFGRKLDELHGSPQDIEWAFDDSGSLFLLQSRPITTL